MNTLRPSKPRGRYLGDGTHQFFEWAWAHDKGGDPWLERHDAMQTRQKQVSVSGQGLDGVLQLRKAFAPMGRHRRLGGARPAFDSDCWGDNAMTKQQKNGVLDALLFGSPMGGICCTAHPLGINPFHSESAVQLRPGQTASTSPANRGRDIVDPDVKSKL